MSKGKYENIFIRCSRETKRRFKLFRDEMDFPNYEKALQHLLDYYYGKISKAPVATH